MKRSPLCGAIIEYFSEDPFLAGKMGAAFINGVQSMGVGTSLKHFAANSQETRRMTVSSLLTKEHFARYTLQPFEIAVKESKPWTVMNSYNRINGVHSSENDWLQNTVLGDEWGFDGVVVSDWGAVNDRVKGINGGNDLEMPSSKGYNSKKIIQAVKNGEIDEETLNERVDKLIDLVIKAQPMPKKEYVCDLGAHPALARKIAGQSMVLLKNEGVLPISKGQKIAVIGEMAKAPRYQGAGSSLINPTKMDNACESLRQAGFDFTYAAGYDKKTVKIDGRKIEEGVLMPQRAPCSFGIYRTDRGI
jgi:beta-glucosidase